MKIFKIDVSKKTDDFNSLYEILEKNSRYAVYPSTFIALAEDDKLIKELQNEKDIQISEVEDIEKDIQREYIKSWLREEYIKQLHKDAELEVKERTQVMYEILKEVEQHFNEEAPNGNKKDAESEDNGESSN